MGKRESSSVSEFNAVANDLVRKKVTLTTAGAT